MLQTHKSDTLTHDAFSRKRDMHIEKPVSLSNLHGLSHTELARLLLRKLWQYHSAGGVSHRRSRRSWLLESLFDLQALPLPNIQEEWQGQDLVEEAQRRLATGPPKALQLCLFQQSGDLPTNALPGQTLGQLLLRNLYTWYTTQSERMIIEEELVRLSLSLWPLEAPELIYEELDLIHEADARISEKNFRYTSLRLPMW